MWWNNCSTQRTLCFWDKKHNKHFHELGLRTKGYTKGTYEAYEGEYPEWAKLAQQVLIDSNKLPDANNFCWKFEDGMSNAGWSVCSCNPLQDHLDSKERINKEVERMNWLMDNLVKK